MYKKIIDKNTQEIATILRVNDGAAIPINADNTDYQQYLAWLAEGNEPLPADTQEAT